MERVLEVLAKYDVTPLQLASWIAFALEWHLDEGRDYSFYPMFSRELSEELNVLSYHL